MLACIHLQIEATNIGHRELTPRLATCGIIAGVSESRGMGACLELMRASNRQQTEIFKQPYEPKLMRSH
jgi:hypothetical protein